MTSTYGEFLYDSSIILAQVFNESRYRSRVVKIERDTSLLHIDNFVTPAVVKECKGKVKLIGEFLSSVVRELNKSIPYEKARINPSANLKLDSRDFPLFMKYFANQKTNLPPGQLKIAQKEQVEYLETWIISNLEDELRKNSPVETDKFFTICAKEATNLYSTLNLELNKRITNFVKSTVTESQVIAIRQKLPFMDDPDDINILAEALEYSKGRKTVLVALDYGHILSKAAEIKEAIGVRVADPLYALNALRNLL
ncbi:MAG: hypothetical protein JRN52_15405 [Nitrososphaerota archaeon]|nr:hypothetical protein [Nitrososphaerota archaeon]